MPDDIRIDVIDETLEPDELEEAALSLRHELLEIDEVDRVSTASSGPAPDGARAIGLTEVGGMIVAAKPTIEVVTRVIGVLRGWLARRSATSTAKPQALKVTINGRSIELTPTAAQQAELVEAFLRTLEEPAPGPS